MGGIDLDEQKDEFWWFFVSFVPCLATYIVLYFVFGDAFGFFSALASIPLLAGAWSISENRSLAQGFIWSLAAIFIFMFTYGSCSLIRVMQSIH